jgi:cellulose synthase/poly-beta-1,6-N-acetylglucosamine synthase-like glycosyltransferase
VHDLFSRIGAFGLQWEWAIFTYFVLVNSFYTLQLFCATWYMWVYVRRNQGQRNWELVGADLLPKVTMLVPAFNEEASISVSLQAILTLDYPSLEVIVINDGSTDNTLQQLRQDFHLYPVHPIYQRLLKAAAIRGMFRSSRHPHLIVVDKANGGKADALNAGLNVATGDLVCALDADTLIEPDALQRLVRPFLQTPALMGCGGTVRIVNNSDIWVGRVRQAHVPLSPLAGFQTVEYLRAFLFGRVGWNVLGGNLIISGAFGIFRREAVVNAGGYDANTIGEDLELVIRMRRRARELKQPDVVEAIPDPVAWTQAPTSLWDLGGQRERWHRGLTQTLARHWTLLFNPRYGVLGLVALPVFTFVEWLAPLLETIGLIALGYGFFTGRLNITFFLLITVVAFGWTTLLSLFAVLLEDFYQRRYQTGRGRLLLAFWALLESFGYRQLTLYWRLKGLVRYIFRRNDWGVMTRAGFGQAQDGTPARAS